MPGFEIIGEEEKKFVDLLALCDQTQVFLGVLEENYVHRI